MSKYQIDVIKETLTDYTFSMLEYLEDAYNKFLPYEGTSCQLKIGTKWFKIYDSQNDLPLIEIFMLNRKEFLDYFLSRGIRFVKR